MKPPLAYFLTWTTHGTWLHGDERGSVDSLHNAPGSARIDPSARLRRAVAARMIGHAIELDSDAREIVGATIRARCDIRGLELLALNVRTNHVHVVVRCPADVTPENAMSQFKSWATRKLREASLMELDQRIWSEHGSTRWINTPEGLNGAVDYVINQQ